MANSGIQWIDYTFDLAVRWLYACADVLGITYEEINVWFFIVFEPLVFALVALYAWHLRNQNAQLRKQLEPISHSTHGSDSRGTGYLVSPRAS